MNIHAVGVHTARPAEGGCTRGVSAERFETPLVGRAACFWRRGGNPPAPAFPRRGKRERGRSNLLAAAGICLRITPEYRPLTPSPQALTATQKPEFPRMIPVVFCSSRIAQHDVDLSLALVSVRFGELPQPLRHSVLLLVPNAMVPCGAIGRLSVCYPTTGLGYLRVTFLNRCGSGFIF